MAAERTPKSAVRTFAPRVRDDLRWLNAALALGNLDHAHEAAMDAAGAISAIIEAIEAAQELEA